MSEEVKPYAVKLPECKVYVNPLAASGAAVIPNGTTNSTITLEYPYPIVAPTESKIDYKFREDEYIAEIDRYIKSTYTQHYSGKYQATDMIIDAGHGLGFTIGSIMKYAKRYGKKDGYNRKDLMKIIHYAIIALYIHDEELTEGETIGN